MIFKKIIKFEIRPEVLSAIRFHAKVNMDNLYDSVFSEDEQCSGYHAFKELVLMKAELPKEYKKMIPGNPGYYLLQRLHELIRQRALDCAHEIRTMFNLH